jgi:tRNA(His) 5'-end guanylyltransferase
MAKQYPKDSLGDRMKQYEATITERYFMQDLPVYARVDGRAFHTFSKGLESQFPTAGNESHQLFKAMQYTCRELVKEFNADVGFVQSDEISLGWTDIKKAPFDKRIFKLESVIASQATGFFYKFALDESLDDSFGGLNDDRVKIRDKVLRICPTFDCRVFQVPSLNELVNCFVWRENDAIKNSVSSYSLEFFSHRELENKTSEDRIKMLEQIGHPWEELPIELRRGTYYKRILHEYKPANGEPYVRSSIDEVFSHDKLAKIANKVEYIFFDAEPIKVTNSKR